MAAPLEKPQIIVFCEESTEITLFDCKWIPSSARFVVLGSEIDGRGVISTYSFSGNGVKQTQIAHQPSQPFKCGTFGASSLQNRFLATGDFAGNFDVWDLEILNVPRSRIRAHDDMINCIDGAGGNGVGAPEIVTGSRDGTVKVWDIRLQDRPVACMLPQDTEKKRDCWAVTMGNSYNETERMIVSGYDNGDIKMFDLRTMKLYWETHVPNGICSLQFDRNDIEMNKLLVSCLEGRIYAYDLRTLHKTKGFAQCSLKRDKSTLWSVKHLPQNRDVFMVTAGGGTVGLYEYKYPENRKKKGEDNIEEGVPGTLRQIQEATLGDQPINSFDWSKDKSGLALCTGFDKKIRIIIATKLNTL